MQYRRLGESGVKLSEIGLGGWLTFGNALDERQGQALIDKAMEAGINFLDTANAYAGGKCEEAWGTLLKSKQRSDFVLATKVFFPMGTGPNDGGLSRKHVFEQCHASLRRLQTDYIDLYQCHRFDPNTPVEETVRVMDDLVRQGKVLYWGFSEWTPQQVQQCLQVCGNRLERPRASQARYNAIEKQWQDELFPLCRQAGIGQVVFSPLAQGVLSGKYKPNEPPPAGSRASDDRQNKFIQRFLTNPDLMGKVQRLIPLAEENGLSMSQLALAWCLRRPEVTTCIIGASRPEQIDENAKASGVKLSDDAVRRIGEILG
jgi:aryl-alcohol dehydrogenase-like predicted oxidoreductase